MRLSASVPAAVLDCMAASGSVNTAGCSGGGQMFGWHSLLESKKPKLAEV